MSNIKSQKVQKAGISYTLGNYLLRGLGFLTIPIFSRILSPEDYGIYNTYIAYEGILFIFLGLALHSSFKNARLKYGIKFNEYVSSCIFLCIINFILIMIFGNIICLTISKNKIGYISILILHSFASAILTYFNDYTSIFFEYKKFLLVSFINAIGNIALSVVLIMTIFKKNAYYGRIWGTVIPLVFITFFIIIKFFRKAKPKLKKEYIQYALRYSLPIIPHGISQVILGQFDRIMISSMVGNSEAGMYSFAYNVYAIVSVTYSSLGTVWSPWFYEYMHAEKIDEIRHASKKYIWGMGIFTAGIMIVSPEIVTIIGTKAYHDAIYLTAPIILGCFFTFLYTLPVQIEYYYEKTKYIALGTICAAILNIILNYIFIPKYGYQAAVYTTAATYILYFIFHYIISINFEKRKVYDKWTFVKSAIFEIIICFLTQIMIEHVIFRWGIGVTLGVIFWGFMDKQFNLRKIIINKLRK